MALYLAALATDHKPATLGRTLTAIGKAHEAVGHPTAATVQHAVVSGIPRSKTDPEVQGSSVALPFSSTAATCPVRSYRAWLTVSEITTMPSSEPWIATGG